MTFRKLMNSEGTVVVVVVVVVADDENDDEVEAKTRFGMQHKNIIAATVTFVGGFVVNVQSDDVLVSSILLP